MKVSSKSRKVTVPPAVAKVVAGAVARNAKMRNRAKLAEVNPVSEYLRQIAAKGGSSQSKKKLVAIRRNIKLAIKNRWKDHD